MSLALFFAQTVSNASTFIFMSLRLCVGILLLNEVLAFEHVEQKIKQVTSVGLSLFNYVITCLIATSGVNFLCILSTCILPTLEFCSLSPSWSAKVTNAMIHLDRAWELKEL